MTKAKVAILYNTSWYIYNFRLNLIKALISDGYKVITIAPNDVYSAKLTEQGCTHYNIRVDSKTKNPLKDLVFIQELKKLLKRIEPDILLNYTAKPNIYGTIVASQLGIPTINNIAGLGSGFVNESFTTKVLRFLYRFSQAKASKVFFQNPDDLNEFITNGLVKREISDLLPGSGVDLTRFSFSSFQKSESDKFIFLFVGRMLYSKGVEILFQASKSMHTKGIRNFKVLLLGESNVNSKDAIQNSNIEEWNKEAFFEYLGKSEDIYTYLKKSHCVVLPSFYREGTPRSLIEALAVGRPIITTDMPGCRNTVVDGDNGFIIDPKNEIDLADKMEKMLSMSELDLAQFGINSRRLAEDKFNEQIVIDKYLESIKKLA